MTNSPGYYSGYSGYGAPGGAFGGYPVGANDREKPRSRALWMAVAVLGLATFGVSFGSPVLLDFAVRLSVAAAIVAAVGLLPKQSSRGWIVVALSVTGFLDALTTWIAADDSGWALVVIVVLNGLQALAAVGALLLEAGVIGAGERDDEAEYAAYASYAQAYQAYAMQYQQPPAQYDAAGQASAHGQNAASARADSAAGARADAAQESYAALQDRYAGYEHATRQQPGGSSGAPAAAAGADPGMPGAGRGAAPTQQPRDQEEHLREAPPG